MSWSRARTPAASGGRPCPRRTGSRTRERFVREVMPGGWADGRWGFAVEADGRYAGTVELRDEGGGRAEIAFGSHPWARGTGTMERACRLVLDWGFAEQGVRTVVWHAHVGNWASRRLAWRLGFSFGGTLRGYLRHRGDELVDAWSGTLLSTDDRSAADGPGWTRRRSPTGRSGSVRSASGDSDRVVEAAADERTQRWLGRMPSPYTSVGRGRLARGDHRGGGDRAASSPGPSPMGRRRAARGWSTSSTSQPGQLRRDRLLGAPRGPGTRGHDPGVRRWRCVTGSRPSTWSGSRGTPRWATPPPGTCSRPSGLREAGVAGSARSSARRVVSTP